MGGRQRGRENKKIVDDALNEEQIIEEGGTGSAGTNEGEEESGVENDKGSEFTIGDSGFMKVLGRGIEKVKNKNEGTGGKKENKDKTAETEAGAGSETETETEAEIDIIGEYQEVVGQFKNEFGGVFRDIPKDTQDDLSNAHKELQNLEKKIEGLKTEKAKENAREKAEQILQELRAKIQEIKDSENKEKKQGTIAEGDEDKNEPAEAKRTETREEGGEREKSDIEEKLEEENIYASQSYKSKIYNRFFDKEKFGLTKDIIGNAQGILEEQMKDVLVEDAKNWLKEQDLDNYPALEGQDIDELSESRIMDLVENKKDFWEQLNKENEEWQDIKNLRKSIEYYGEKTPPDIKTALMKRMPAGPAREKLWEKITGESLDETAKEEAGIGEKEVYINDASRLTDQEDLIEFFVKNKLLGTHFEFSYAEWEKSLEGFDKKQREVVVNRMGQQKKEQEKEMKKIKENIKKVYPKKMMTGEDKKILALMNEGYDIENIKLKGFFFKKVELQKVDGTKETKEYKEFLEFVDDKVKGYNTDLEEKAKEDLSQKWTEKIDAEKFVIVDSEAEKSTEDTIENCYQKMARDVAARFLEKQVNKDPKRKAKIEKNFGKNKKEDIQDYISDAIGVGETIEDGSGYDENEDELKGTLEAFNINPEKLTEFEKEEFAEFSGQKYGLIDWIFDILFEKIKGNKATTKK